VPPSPTAPYPLTALRLAFADRETLVVVVLATLLKLLVVLVLGHPTLSTEGDAPGYLAFAQSIVHDGQWLHPPSWIGDPLPTTIIRLAGYPLVIAAAMVVGGDHFVSVLLVFQIAVSTLVLLVVTGLAAAVIASRGWRVALAVAVCFGSPFLYDMVGLSDSLYAALFTLVVFGIAGEIAGIWRLTTPTLLALGIVWGCSILVRDAGQYFTALPVVGLIALAPGGCGGLVPRLRRIGVFLLPVLAITSAYAGFNQLRTGHYFLSVAGVVNYLYPVFRLSETGTAGPLDGDDPVSRTWHGIGAGHDLAGMVATVSALMQARHLNTLEAAGITRAKLTDTIRRFPGAYARLVLINLKLDKQAFNLTNPTYILNDLLAFGPFVGARTMPGFQQTFRQLRHHFSIGVLLTFMATEAFDIPSLLLFALFLLGVPAVVLARGIRGSAITGRLWLAFYLWSGYVGLVVAYALVHFEIRYMLPVVPSALLAMTIMVETIRGCRRPPLHPPSPGPVAMPRLPNVAVLTVALPMMALTMAVPAGGAAAQTPSQVQTAPPLSPEEIEGLRRDKNQLALYHYGSRYAFDVLLGGIAGGVTGAVLRGGPVATITGSTLGSLLGILWFLDGYAGEMIDKHGW